MEKRLIVYWNSSVAPGSSWISVIPVTKPALFTRPALQEAPRGRRGTRAPAAAAVRRSRAPGEGGGRRGAAPPAARGGLRRNKRQGRARGGGRCPPLASRGRSSFTVRRSRSSGDGARRQRPGWPLPRGRRRPLTGRSALGVSLPGHPLPCSTPVTFKFRFRSRCSFLRVPGSFAGVVWGLFYRLTVSVVRVGGEGLFCLVPWGLRGPLSRLPSSPPPPPASGDRGRFRETFPLTELRCSRGAWGKGREGRGSGRLLAPAFQLSEPASPTDFVGHAWSILFYLPPFLPFPQSGSAEKSLGKILSRVSLPSVCVSAREGMNN